MKIIGITSVFPPTVIKSSERVYKNIGIKQRTVNGISADLCEAAANDLFKLLNIQPTDVDCIFAVTQVPLYGFPTDACVLQGRLGCRTDIPALDSTLGCSAYTYALFTINALLKSKSIKNCLLLVGDGMSKHIDPNDSATAELFSDCGTASFILPSDDEPVFDCFTDGKGYDAIIKQNELMKLDGMRVFKFATVQSPKSILRLNIDFSTVDHLVLHQANQMINDVIVKKLKIESTKALSSLELGNTSTASIPITLNYCFDGGSFEGKNLLMSGFGVGLSVCSVYLPNQSIKFGKIRVLQ